MCTSFSINSNPRLFARRQCASRATKCASRFRRQTIGFTQLKFDNYELVSRHYFCAPRHLYDQTGCRDVLALPLMKSTLSTSGIYLPPTPRLPESDIQFGYSPFQPYCLFAVSNQSGVGIFLVPCFKTSCGGLRNVRDPFKVEWRRSFKAASGVTFRRHRGIKTAEDAPFSVKTCLLRSALSDL